MKSEKIFYIISITAVVLYLVLLPVFHPYPLSYLLNRKIENSRLPYIIAILIYSLMVGFFLRNIDPDFLIPVFAYLTVISVMTISAFLMKDFSWAIDNKGPGKAKIIKPRPLNLWSLEK